MEKLLTVPEAGHEDHQRHAPVLNPAVDGRLISPEIIYAFQNRSRSS